MQLQLTGHRVPRLMQETQAPRDDHVQALGLVTWKAGRRGEITKALPPCHLHHTPLPPEYRPSPLLLSHISPLSPSPSPPGPLTLPVGYISPLSPSPSPQALSPCL